MAVVDKVFIGIFIALLFVTGMALMFMRTPATTGSKVLINDTVVNVEIARTPDERARGLSNRASLPRESGMLFVFEEEGYYQFWMKETLIPLDMIWADKAGTIVTVVSNVQPSSFPTRFTSDSPALYVLEVNAGFADANGIAEGSKLVVQY